MSFVMPIFQLRLFVAIVTMLLVNGNLNVELFTVVTYSMSMFMFMDKDDKVWILAQGLCGPLYSVLVSMVT